MTRINELIISSDPAMHYASQKAKDLYEEECLDIDRSKRCLHSQPMTPTSRPPITARSGSSQIATAAVLLTYLWFTSEWRFWITVELAVALVFSGSVLVVYASTARRMPFRDIVETWLPMPPIQLATFLVLFGAGLAFTEQGNSMIGIILIFAGYGTFSVQSILKLVKKLTH